MNKLQMGLVGILGVTTMTLVSQPAEAAAFMRLSANAATVTCDTTLATNNVVGGNCAATEGFLLVSPTQIIFVGNVDGYSISSISLAGNVPGTALLASTQDTKTAITHNSGAGDLTIDMGLNNFNFPTGPQLVLSSAQTANLASSALSDGSTFTAWARSDNNANIVPGGTSTAIAPACGVPAGTTNVCATSSSDVAFTRLAGMFALTGREVITLALASSGSFSSTVAVVPQVPEPASLLLLGTGLVGMAKFVRRRRSI